jgi:tetratricopeptide (TPR) repeat protein
VLAGWAAGRETVLVFEDLHWADDALLSFLEHLADWAENVQLLVLCTARPELYERHRGWAGGLRNATTINLPALTDAETASLVTSLLERAVLPAETQRVLLERAGGNPLYAEEFVRLLGDRSQFGEAVEVPESVQALIAARLDTLDTDRKSLLQDASVVGKVFWTGVLAEMGGRGRDEVEQALHELARKELVRPAASSSMDGEAEYAFWHVLVRDVCYQQIPRAARSARHQMAAAWLESSAGERIEDLADMLAHHYLTALELARAGEPSDANDLAPRAIEYLALAGERALGLDIAQAEALFGRAVELARDAELESPELVVRWSEALLQAGRSRDAAPLLEEALQSFRERGETEATAQVLIMLSRAAIGLGEQPRNLQLANDAVSVLEQGRGGALLVDAYAQVSNANLLAGDYRAAVAAANRALAIAEQLGLPLPVEALGWRGIARAYLNEYEGVAEAERALDLLIEAGSSSAIARLMNNLAIVRAPFDGPVATVEAYERAIAFNRERGRSTVMIGANRTETLIEVGRSQEALQTVKLLEADAETHGLRIPLMQLRTVEATCLTLHGEPALTHADWLFDFARETGTTDSIMNIHPALAGARLAAGQADQARALLLEIDATPDARTNPNYAPRLPGMVRTALAAGDPTLAKRLLDDFEPVNPLREHALQHAQAQLAEAEGNNAEAAKFYADAAENWRKFGNVPEHAYALLGQGRCLLASGDTAAEAPLAEARGLFASIGYKPALAETEKLLAQALNATAQ